MRLLLDTHVLLWALGDSAKLSARMSAALRDPANQVLASAASIWEISIKAAMGKLELPAPPAEWLLPAIEQTGIDTLPIEPDHAVAVGALPPHHRDPFDRMLIAQANVEDMTLVTADLAFDAYDVATLKA